MELIRLLIVSVTGLLMVGGYLASVSAYFSGNAVNYSQNIEGSMVPWLSLGLLVAIVVLACLPHSEEEVGESE